MPGSSPGMTPSVLLGSVLLGDLAVPLEHEMAEPLTGHHFFLHADNPGLGILRLDTKNDQRWLLMTRQSLLALSE